MYVCVCVCKLRRAGYAMSDGPFCDSVQYRRGVTCAHILHHGHIYIYICIYIYVLILICVYNVSFAMQVARCAPTRCRRWTILRFRTESYWRLLQCNRRHTHVNCQLATSLRMLGCGHRHSIDHFAMPYRIARTYIYIYIYGTFTDT